MTNDKKLMLLAGVLALGMLAGCSSASAASAASGMAGSMPAASEVEEVSSEVRVLPGEEGVMMPIDQGSLEEMKTGSYKFAANISSVDAKKRQMTLTVYGYDHLVASAPQRQIQCFDCVLAQFFQIVAFAGNTNAHCRSDLIADMDLTYTV